MNIPKGWKLVPVLPTYQMCEEMGIKWESGPGFPIRYESMLAVAPTPPDTSQEDRPETLFVKHVSFFNVQVNDDIDERVTFFNAGYEAGYAKAKMFQK